MLERAKYYLFFVILLYKLDFSFPQDVDKICRERCGNILNDITGLNDLRCNASCRLSQCQSGCAIWKDAVRASCQDMCNNTAFAYNKDQYCVTGCNAALDIYAGNMEAALGKLRPPVLVPYSLTNSSLQLRWDGEKIKNITYVLQWKFANINPSDWRVQYKQFVPPTSMVTDLKPFTTYKFRIVAVITTKHLIESPPSNPIQTLPSGPPTSAPVLVGLSSPSATVVHISWQPPMFTNGPLTGFRLCLQPLNNTSRREILKEVSSKLSSYTFSSLQPDTYYKVSLSAWNTAGLGPSAWGEIATPAAFGGPSAVPYMIYGADNMILKQDITDFLKDRQAVYTGEQSIRVLADVIYQDSWFYLKLRGVTVHTARKLVFFSDGTGKVHRIKLNRNNSHDVIYKSFLHPSALSVDWLNDKLYIVEDNKILQCTLDGVSCFPVLTNLYPTPDDVKADPYNGYLYWTQFGQGLFRMDLNDIGKKGSRPSQYRIIRQDMLYTLFIDHQNYRLYFPNSTMNTIMSSSLDGTDLTDIRPNMQRPYFLLVKSLLYFDKLFYWTNGEYFSKEEFDPRNDVYHHNKMFFLERHFLGLNLFHPSAQPKPVPTNPPMKVQALFTDKSAQVSWKKPELLKEKGRGAWQQWLYQIRIRDERNVTRIVDAISDLEHKVYHLRPNVTYTIQVRGYSNGEHGPWSTEFVGRTLLTESVKPYILAASENNLIQTDVDGGNEIPIITIKNDNQAKVTDIHVYRDTYIFSMDNGKVYKFYSNETVPQEITHIHDATAVVLDWLAEKIYWSNVKQSMIFRSDLHGNSIETVYQAPARDMVIDSLSGYLYWTTTHSLECAILNGANHYDYQTLPFLSEQFVLGLALDRLHGNIYWIKKGYDGGILFTAPVATDDMGTHQPRIREIGQLGPVSRMPLLQYFSDRLFLMTEGDQAVISDVNGTNLARMDIANRHPLRTLSVVHPSLQPYPVGLDRDLIRVIPNDILADAINVVGNWSNFNITWPGETRVNHGRVYYQVLLIYLGKEQVNVTDNPFYNLRDLKPFIPIEVHLRAFTCWGSSKTVRTHIRSPMSVPSVPSHPRVYVTHNHRLMSSDISIDLEFRWSRPMHVNGILIAYNLYYHNSKGEKKSRILTSQNTDFSLDNCDVNVKYYFTVEACTKVGCGDRTEVVSANTSVDNPIPRLLVAQNLTLMKLDVDEKVMTLLIRGRPLTLAYLALDNILFWIDVEDRMMSYNGVQRNEMFKLQGNGRSLAIDWIARSLYWLEDQENNTVIMSYSIERGAGNGTLVLESEGIIRTLHVDPYHSALYWTETTIENETHLYTSLLNGSDVQAVFPSTRRAKRAVEEEYQAGCNCGDMSMSPAFVLDHMNGTDVVIYGVNLDQNTIFMTDSASCVCKQLYKGWAGYQHGLPPDSLTVDSKRLYWVNKASGLINSIDKKTGLNFVSERIQDIQAILAFGPHLQRLPDIKCLLPGNQTDLPVFLGSTNTTVTLDLEPPRWVPRCNGISKPPLRYRVHYRRLEDNETVNRCAVISVGCSVQESYERRVTINGLEPYSNYVFQVSNTNFYSMREPPVFGPPYECRTKEGIPSKPLDVKAVALRPDRIKISWETPEKLHGNESDIFYVIRWLTENSDGTTSQGEEVYQTRSWSSHPILSKLHKNQAGNKYYKKNLEAGQNYTFWVIVRNKQMDESLYSISDMAQNRTFTFPQPVTLISCGRRNLTLSWEPPVDHSIMRHFLEYKAVAEDDDFGMSLSWGRHTPQPTRYDKPYVITLTNLLPNMYYATRIVASYRTTPRDYLLSMFRWPLDYRYKFKTLADAPEAPIVPNVRRLGDGLYEVLWDVTINNGAEVDNYQLEARPAETNSTWETVYNGVERKWKIEELEIGMNYSFRVAARNEHGWSYYSKESEPFFLDRTAGPDNLTLILAGSFTALLIFIITTAAILIAVLRSRRQDKKMPVNFILKPPAPDVELANLRELPTISVQQANTLYAISIIPSEEEIAKLPHFRRDQLTLTHFLGSGAFGEVFEGLATNILAIDSGETKVAVKTLRKGASPQEKEEFLKEALLMSNFKHKHILSLLGVCLDNDPQFIILELMEGGDLLSFLRASRPTLTTPALLSLTNLIGIAGDVAEGCEYLEDMHFVHRDLAARNCLVAHQSTGQGLLVKIGDFGLARDIYKNDYYRKEGEGLLPVRWMSPESLMDGVFTTQSDMWAFGVLIWEVMTLGQQPYPARTNIEVLHFVRSGGRLDKPENCPLEVYNLMLKCWSYSPDDRPTFSYLREQLQQMKERATEFAENALIGGFDNLAFDTIEGKMGMRSRLDKDKDYLSPNTSRKFGAVPPEGINLSPTKKRLRSLLGCYDDSVVPESPTEPFAPAIDRVKRAASFDSKEFSDMCRLQRFDALGYLNPKDVEHPKYLTLIPDPSPTEMDPPMLFGEKKPRLHIALPEEGGSDGLQEFTNSEFTNSDSTDIVDNDRTPITSRKLTSFKPVPLPRQCAREKTQPLVNGLLRNSDSSDSGHSLQYAQIDGVVQNPALDRESSVEPESPEKLKGKGMKRNYSKLPTSDIDSESDSESSFQSGTGSSERSRNIDGPAWPTQSLNYAQLALSTDEESDSGKNRCKNNRRANKSDRRSSNGSRRTTNGNVPKQTNHKLPNADVRSKITGDTDLSKTGLFWANNNCRLPEGVGKSKSPLLASLSKRKGEYINIPHDEDERINGGCGGHTILDVPTDDSTETESSSDEQEVLLEATEVM
ncbi:proto-oncogene tyrosine-protein kinase ROS-like isoform X2 [Lineus longissimus]|uniref:proto-oncogene tyrosine-protein kinase ROS-like isoform X2 n=1 Tax=Lineus longissimus TaxID=88925 RepID=UPI002B4ED40B